MDIFDTALKAVPAGLSRAIDLALEPDMLPYTLAALVVIGFATVRLLSAPKLTARR